ncbi:TetR family transcriptional regulator [Nocardiopsis sp. NPDC006832]|uniref:TetR/AcrR family transcriptional regulator n=1 Tax=Nocardiopsis sp. NPDC006832 TaxID=3157188 RepID=UPI0033E4CEA0
MSSAPRDDLTARARIRDAALARFGRDGFGVSVRAIAEEAGVSPGLVIHHFGSKEKLRAACDEHVLRLTADTKGEVVTRMSATHFLQQLAEVDGHGDVFAYLMRSLQSGGHVASALFERMVQDVEIYLAEGERAGTIRPSRDPAARARYAASMSLGSLMLHTTMRPQDADRNPSTVLREWIDAYMLPALELYTEGLLLDSTFLDAFVAHRDDPPANDH